MTFLNKIETFLSTHWELGFIGGGVAWITPLIEGATSVAKFITILAATITAVAVAYIKIKEAIKVRNEKED